MPESVAKLLTASVAGLVVQQEDAESIAYSSKNFNDVFTLGEVLGQGSYGTVRAATHKETGQQYAVKILHKRRNNEERTEVIENEVSLMFRAFSGMVLQLYSRCANVWLPCRCYISFS